MDEKLDAAETLQLQTWFDKFWLMGAIALVLVFLILPMFAISWYSSHAPAPGNLLSNNEASVGIAAILRFAARRILRAGTSGVLSAAFGAVSRTSARTMIRRTVRMTIKTAAVAGQQALAQSIRGDKAQAAKEARAQNPLLAVGLGCAALFLSFWTILEHVVTPSLRNTIIQDMSTLQAALIAALPLGMYALLAWFFSRFWHVKVQFSTGIDGLFLQAYFTGAGSFLPLTTDMQYIGAERSVRRVAATTLLANYVLFLILLALSNALGAYPLKFAAAITLIYVFVFAFPIKPLDGHYIWAKSKLQWVLLFLPILAAFFLYIPESLNDIL